MDATTGWFLIFGGVLTSIGILSPFLKRLPLTTSLLYLGVGYLLGPRETNFLWFEPLKNSKILEHLSEIVVIISLFSAGLKLRLPLSNRRWWVAVRLASTSMIITICCVTAFAVWVLKLPLAAGVLLGAILAPTDPVLASSVQVKDTQDRDLVRFGLTGEAGLNDGTAFPFVMLGLGLLGLHEIGNFGMRWVLVDLLWATVAGLAIGTILGNLMARFVSYLREQHKETAVLDDFLSLGLIALSYGIAIWAKSYGFLSVFAAALALRRVERVHSEQTARPDEEPHSAKMAHEALKFNEQLERLGEVSTVILLGSMLAFASFSFYQVMLMLFLFIFVRPFAVYLGLIGTPPHESQHRLMSWFGVRGIGSIYYLMYAIQRGVPADLAQVLINCTFFVVTFSIILHGVSVTPLMNWYESKRAARA